MNREDLTGRVAAYFRALQDRICAGLEQIDGAGRFRDDDLDAAATQVKVTGKPKPKDVKIDYPPGKEENDKTVGKYRYYEDKVEIPINVQRAAGDTGPLELSVRFMACKKSGICKLPATVKLTVR